MRGSTRLLGCLSTIAASVISLTITSPVHADNLSVTLQAGAYEVITRADGLQSIRMDGFGQVLVAGKPHLPARTFLIAVPPDAEVRSVQVTAGAETPLAGTYSIRPAPVAAPLSPHAAAEAEGQQQWEANYRSTYGADAAYPATAGRWEGTGAYRQVRFVRVTYFPFSFNPQQGTLVHRPTATVSIDYGRGGSTSRAGGAIPLDGPSTWRAAELMVNFGGAQSWYSGPATAESATDSYDYVVITTGALSTALQPLIDWKEFIGFRVNLVTTSWIQANYTGRDLAEQIRNFLIDKYLEWGVRYVLLAGNIDSIPMRHCYPDSTNHGHDQWFCPPSDYYYADLTGNWDADGDGYFGEYVQDSVDYIPEVYVGRIPWSDHQTLGAICEKLVAYEADTGAWKDRALLVGTFANFENQNFTGYPVTDFAVFQEKMIVDMLSGWDHTTMYETAGLVPSVYPCDIPVSASAFIDTWSTGQYGIVNWGGHGSNVGAARLIWDWDDGDGVPESSIGELSTPYFVHRDWVHYLNDAYPSITFHVSCLNAYPEVDNLARELLGNGSAGTLASTRVAWYAKGWDHEDDGLVESNCYFFWDQLINQGKTIGEATYDSKAYYAAHIVFDSYRHHQNLLNYVLYGEPALLRQGVTAPCVDSDGDGVSDPGQIEAICGADNCPDLANPDQLDFDDEGFGDVCDACPSLATPDNVDLMPGDVNADTAVASTDVIYLVNYVFKGGPIPIPVGACGDINCDARMTSTDILALVSYVFKSGPSPCNMCMHAIMQ